MKSKRQKHSGIFEAKVAIYTLPEWEVDIEVYIANIFSDYVLLDYVQEYYRQAFSLDQEKSIRININTYFLNEKDRNIYEDLELVYKV